MSDKNKDSKGGFVDTLGNTADRIIGDMVLGSIGVAGYHLGKVGPIGKTGAYIRDNIADGFHSAEYEDLKRSAAKKLAVTMQSGLPLTSEDQKKGLLALGVADEDCDAVRAAAERRVTGKKAPSIPADPAAQVPETTLPIPPVPAPDVPLPQTA